MGGLSADYEYCSDGVILNDRTQEVTAINPCNDSQIKFWSLGESYMEMHGVLLSLVRVGKEINLIRYRQAENSITTLHNYGKKL